ncbi:MAG: hypothetical protein N7Q72_00990, partial [Spiroplasma sp. Tabriz.8]|nr:hypothetical protein [Spiroplasma sp. Tabriz.8]
MFQFTTRKTLIYAFLVTMRTLYIYIYIYIYIWVCLMSFINHQCTFMFSFFFLQNLYYDCQKWINQYCLIIC